MGTGAAPFRWTVFGLGPVKGPGRGAGRGPPSLNGQAIERKHLESQLAALLAGRSDRLVLFDAEDDVGCAHAVDILDAIRQLVAAWPPEGHEELPISAARAAEPPAVRRTPIGPAGLARLAHKVATDPAGLLIDTL